MKKLLPKLQKLRKHLVLVCYLAYAALWLLCNLWHFAGDHLRPEVTLDLSAAALDDAVWLEDDVLLTQSVDPKLVWEGLDERARLVLLRADFAREPYEMELFYAKKAGQGFSVRQRVIGRPVAGGYLYALPAGRLRALRVDAGIANQNTVEISAVVLNPRLPAVFYFLPSLRDIMAALVVPALAYAVIYSILEWMKFLRRKGDSGSKNE